MLGSGSRPRAESAIEYRSVPAGSFIGAVLAALSAIGADA